MYSTNPAMMSEALVTALFADRTLSFNLPEDSTFADLAGRLEYLGGWHTGMPAAVSLKFAMGRQSAILPSTLDLS